MAPPTSPSCSTPRGGSPGTPVPVPIRTAGRPASSRAGRWRTSCTRTTPQSRLRRCVRDRDLVGRLGGDEFAVVVRAGLDESTALAERILTELAGVHRSVPTLGADPDLVFDVSCSIGVTELHPADDVMVTFRNADLALRAAKAAGKGCVRRHGETADAATVRRTRLARDLPDALAR